MGALENGTKVVGGVVSGLAGNPILLALIVLNVLWMGIGVWIIREVSQGNQRKDLMMLQLAKDCTFPAPKKD